MSKEKGDYSASIADYHKFLDLRAGVDDETREQAEKYVKELKKKIK